MKVILSIQGNNVAWRTDDGKYGINTYLTNKKVIYKHIKETLEAVGITNYEIIYENL